MDSDVLENNLSLLWQRFSNSKGFGLLELSLAVLLAGIFFSVIAAAGQGIAFSAKGQRTAQEMSSLLEMSYQYRLQKGEWPKTLADMKDVFSNVPLKNFWGQAFVLGGNEMRAWVETDVPVKAVSAFSGQMFTVVRNSNSFTTVRGSQNISYGKVARLAYERAHGDKK
ncbi:MAG: hypothetical protein HQL16_04865 [Candidatus Omnitrophica bacterium]|nr:hypothetical protein [Candidatus Omnitrophota bacterium]